MFSFSIIKRAAMLKGKDEVDAPKVQDNIFALSQPKTAPSIFDRKLITSAATSQPFSTQVSFYNFCLN